MKTEISTLKRIIYKFSFISRGLVATAILLLLVQQLIEINLYASFFGVIGFSSLSLLFLLSAFDSLDGQPDWEIVFPELRNNPYKN